MWLRGYVFMLYYPNYRSTVTNPFRHDHSFPQGFELVVDFLQFTLALRLRHNSRPGLKDQFVVMAQHRADHDRMVKRPVKSQDSDCAAIKSAVYVFVPVDKRHSHMFWRTGKRPRRKGVGRHTHHWRSLHEVSGYF